MTKFLYCELQKDRERKKDLRKNETPEQKERRLAKNREYHSVKKQNESFEDKQARLDNDQSSEKREQKLAKKRKNTNARRQLIRDVESTLDKQVRLEKN